jgi:hypothetical protein
LNDKGCLFRRQPLIFEKQDSFPQVHISGVSACAGQAPASTAAPRINPPAATQTVAPPTDTPTEIPLTPTGVHRAIKILVVGLAKMVEKGQAVVIPFLALDLVPVQQFQANLIKCSLAQVGK